MEFIAPSFLFGLAAISIPVIIHLVQLRRAKKVFFTNVAFIKEVKNITASHRRLKELLILMCRIAFILFLVLAFAQPFLPGNGLTLGNKPASKFFLDNSFSMQNEPDVAGSSLLETAISHCRKVIAAVGKNGRFGYLDHSGFSSIYNDYTSTKLQAKLEEVDFSADPKSFASVLSGMSAARDASYNAVIYSDFQRKAFTPTEFKLLDPKQNYFFVHLKGNAEHNIFVDSLQLEDEFIRVRQNNRLQVKVRNSGVNNFPNCNIKFFVGNQQVSALNINLPAKQSVSFLLNFRLEDQAPKNCRIVVQDFPVEFDNTFYFTLKASPPVHLVDLADKPGTVTGRLYTNEPLFKYQHFTPGQFNYRQLADANLIILNANRELAAAFAENLRKFILAGGSVAYIPSGEQQGSDQVSFLKKIGLGAVQASKYASDNPAQYDLAQPDIKNPFFKNIFDSDQSRLAMPRSARLLTWSRSSGDLLKFKDGNKFLSVFKIGQGQIFLFAAPFDEKFSGFANHALFVPVMYKMALESYQNPVNLAYSLNASDIQVPVGQVTSREVFKLRRDSLEFVPEQQIREGMLHFSIPSDMNAPGVYSLVTGRESLGNFAFNFDKRESDLNFYTAEEIKDLSGNAPNVHVLDASDESAIKKMFSPDNAGTQLWKYCLILCLVFALSEILLIRFM